jgi:MFS transporter, OCT family, solute carrier family 22 (organic cation transporter), member 4/5
MMVLPLMIMGGLMVAGGVCALMLPETLHQHLPQTLEEGEQFGRDFGPRQWLTCCPPSAENENELEEIKK